MTTNVASALLAPGSKLWMDGELATVVAVVSQTGEGADLVVESPKAGLRKALLTRERVVASIARANDGTGDPQKELTSLWGKWMQYATPRIRSAVLATRPIRPFPHQDEAVFSHMLPQPRLRFLL